MRETRHEAFGTTCYRHRSFLGKSGFGKRCSPKQHPGLDTERAECHPPLPCSKSREDTDSLLQLSTNFSTSTTFYFPTFKLRLYTYYKLHKLHYTPPQSTEHSHVNGTVHARCTIRHQSWSSLTCTSTERAVDPSVIVVRRVAREGLSCTHAIGRCRTLPTHDVLCPNLRFSTTKSFPVHCTGNYSGSR